MNNLFTQGLFLKVIFVVHFLKEIYLYNQEVQYCNCACIFLLFPHNQRLSYLV